MPKKHFVSKYKWSHHSKRKKFLKLEKAGKITRVATLHDGWMYQEIVINK